MFMLASLCGCRVELGWYQPDWPFGVDAGRWLARLVRVAVVAGCRSGLQPSWRWGWAYATDGPWTSFPLIHRILEFRPSRPPLVSSRRNLSLFAASIASLCFHRCQRNGSLRIPTLQTVLPNGVLPQLSEHLIALFLESDWYKMGTWPYLWRCHFPPKPVRARWTIDGVTLADRQSSGWLPRQSVTRLSSGWICVSYKLSGLSLPY